MYQHQPRPAWGAQGNAYKYGGSAARPYMLLLLLFTAWNIGQHV
jgi:hypothetical protein